eukprot:667017-Pyramimonas_sp.AAC.1
MSLAILCSSCGRPPATSMLRWAGAWVHGPTSPDPWVPDATSWRESTGQPRGCRTERGPNNPNKF